MQSAIVNRQSGMALIVTLILLAVTLVMAIAFLAISNRERGSVSTETDTTVAKYAADAALAHAEAQIVANIFTNSLGTNNPYVFGLLVSTNYINRAGFTNDVPASLENVSYNYPNGQPVEGADLEQNVANLFYYPRPPVFYGSNDFRFYLDLNRNGQFDDTWWVFQTNNLGKPILDASDLIVSNFEVGDPQWIGILEHPDAPHGPNNPFIARYCFIAVPANSLDLNYIHNQALEAPGGSTVNAPSATEGDAYSRDQGVGTWEMNLAAFLTDLNTNSWDPLNEPYSYPELRPGDSMAFDDARSLIAWRYNNSYPLQASAASANGLWPWAYEALLTNGIDAYSLGQQTTFDTNFYNVYEAENAPNLPWAGSENTNNFFNLPSDLFNTSKAIQDSALTQPPFATNLYVPGTYNSTYDRYTYYRMLGQIGTDTLPVSGKLNVNYSNAIVNLDANGILTNFVIVPNLETNFTPWQPQAFFTAAANMLLNAYTTAWYEESPSNYLQTYYGLVDTTNLSLDGNGVANIQYYGQTNQIPSFGITNIPVYVNGSFVYSPAVNRLLQLAANIYDASTNTMNAASGMSNYPSVFRPVFWVTNELAPYGNGFIRETNVYIRGYRYVQEQGGLQNNLSYNGPGLFAAPIEVTDPRLVENGEGISTSNVWGVPWIIGAKKGFPNFNGLEVDNVFFIERELQYNRLNTNSYPSGTGPSTIAAGRGLTTNQMYIMGISNVFAIEHWNSYANTFVNPVSIVLQYSLGFALSNNAPGYVQVNNPYVTNNEYALSGPTNFADWPGSSYSTSFVLPIGINTVMQNLSPAGSPPCITNTYVYFYGSPSFSSTNLDGFEYDAPCFIPTSQNPANYMDRATPQLPNLVMLTTNRLQAYMLDTRNAGASYIIDYVQLGGMNNSLDINQAIADPDYTGLWSTNVVDSPGNTPFGIGEQYLVSSGGATFPTADADEGSQGWSTASVPGAGTDVSPTAQEAYFKAFFAYDNEATYAGGNLLNIALSVQAPFTPMRIVVQRNVYQANDPLVHYLASDLYDFQDSTNGTYPMGNPSGTTGGGATPPPTIKYIGKLSDRYMPWGNTKNQMPGNFVYNYLSWGVLPQAITPVSQITENYIIGTETIPTDSQNPYNLSYRDPLVWSSDNWDFPSYKYPNVGWLGRVHRGTPWQTVFLKSTNVWQMTTVVGGGSSERLYSSGPPTWQLFTGNVFNPYDAENAAPVWDQLLFDLFTATPDDDATRGQLNINIGADDPTDDPNHALAGLASWSALLSGTLVFSNSLDNARIGEKGYLQAQDPISFLSQYPPYFSVVTNQPLGAPVSGSIFTNSALYQIVQGINNTRATFTNIDGLGGVFEHAGNILSTPQLSDASPFLNLYSAQQLNGISDEMYEWLPQQIMGLLTVSGTPQAPPRYVIYCYGQTLKPAPNGIVSSGSFFGLCTNYQVTAESAARAVIRVENAPTPANPSATPRIVIEQFDPLPPN